MQRLARSYRAPASLPFARRSHCYWIESAGMEGNGPIDPLRGDHSADVVIVGGGYTGLSAALHLSDAFPQQRIVLLEGARVGSGASGRNGGLVMPSINGAEPIVLRLLETGRTEEAQTVHERASAGVEIIEKLAATPGVDCDWERVDCLVTALTARHEALLKRELETSAALGMEAAWQTASELRPRVHASRCRGALRLVGGAVLHPAKLARGVLGLVRARGVEVHEGSPVTEIRPGPTVTVRTAAGSVRASALVLATNAYTPRLGLFRRRILPVHWYSIATAPLSEAQVDALRWGAREFFLDARSLFESFRLTSDNRIIYSGGDVRYRFNGTVTDSEDHPAYRRLERAFRDAFPTLQDVPVTHRWVGHIGLTLDGVPTVGVLGRPRNVFFAGGYSGRGVPVAFLAGRLLCELYAGQSLDSAFDFILDRRPPLTPPEPFSSVGFALYKRYVRWADARE